jgi:hypothetical protein
LAILADLSCRVSEKEKVLTYFSARHLLHKEIMSSQNSIGKSDVECFVLNFGKFSKIVEAKDTCGAVGKASLANSSIVLR